MLVIQLGPYLARTLINNRLFRFDCAERRKRHIRDATWFPWEDEERKDRQNGRKNSPICKYFGNNALIWFYRWGRQKKKLLETLFDFIDKNKFSRGLLVYKKMFKWLIFRPTLMFRWPEWRKQCSRLKNNYWTVRCRNNQQPNWEYWQKWL